MKEELYVSISPETYRNSKSKILLNQVDILQIAKKLQNLKILSKQKYELKKQLQQLLSSTLSQLEIMQEKMPTPKIPKAVQKTEEEIEKPKASPSNQSGIDEELKSIQAKLQELNS